VRRPVVSLLVLALTGVAVASLAACGEEDAQLLPGETAREITANLDTVQQLADEGDCIGAESAALQVSEQVEALGNVDERLQRALRDGAARLNEVVAGCEEEAEAATPEVTEPETETTPADEEEEKEREKQEREEEKEEDKEQREEKREEKETPPPLPPQSEGEGKGREDGDESGPGGNEGEGSPSGGVSPGAPADEG
jgi:outer membrane biosynthesis protein TonB